MKFKIIHPDGIPYEVKGKMLEIKQFPDFLFFYHKSLLSEDVYDVREFSTGLRVGSGPTMASARKVAVGYLQENIGTDMDKFRAIISTHFEFNKQEK